MRHACTLLLVRPRMPRCQSIALAHTNPACVLHTLHRADVRLPMRLTQAEKVATMTPEEKEKFEAEEAAKREKRRLAKEKKVGPGRGACFNESCCFRRGAPPRRSRGRGGARVHWARVRCLNSAYKSTRVHNHCV